MKLNYKRTILIGFAFMSICAFWQIYDSIVPLMLKNTFQFNEGVTGIIMAADNVLAIFLLPWFGGISDKTHTKLGKRMPFIVFGTIVSSILVMLLPITDNHKAFVPFVVTLFLLLIAMGTYRSPAVAMMPDLTPKHLRSKANAVINLMGTVGGIYTLVAIKFLIPDAVDGHVNYLVLFLTTAVFMLASVLVLFLTIKENKYAAETAKIEDEIHKAAALENKLTKEEEEAANEKVPMPKDVKKSLIFLLCSVALWFVSYNAISTAFSRYAEEVWNLKGGAFADSLIVATVAAVISFVPIGMLSTKFGRKKVIISGVVLITLMYACGIFINEYSMAVNVIFAFTGIAWAAINVNSYPMVVEMSKGADVGKYTGLYYTFSMFAQIITPILSGYFLEKISYRILFPYATVFSILSLCTMLFVKHGDSKAPTKGSLLEHFDN